MKIIALMFPVLLLVFAIQANANMNGPGDEDNNCDLFDYNPMQEVLVVETNSAEEANSFNATNSFNETNSFNTSNSFNETNSFNNSNSFNLSNSFNDCNSFNLSNSFNY